MTPEQTQVAAALIAKFAALRISAKLEKIEPGPIITGYYFKPNIAQPLNKILNYEEDLAMAAGQDVVTIQRIKGDVVVFVANKDRKDVDFKTSLWQLSQLVQINPAWKLPICLGVNHLGDFGCLDLTDCPHLLIAGATLSGKSTFQKAIICSLATVLEPSEMNLYLIDTKRLELTLFKGLPHALDIADNIQSARQIFENVMLLTRKRYELFQNERVTNVSEYITKTRLKIPYRVVMIDELADLLTLDGEYCKAQKELDNDCKPIKKYLQELAAIARAAGTHIIAGTQRPSVKIIDGDTKANFPCRIALKMASRFDSQTILDECGAETLLGKGDMLVKRVDSSVLERYHGPHVRLDDIEQIVGNLEAVKQSLNLIRS